MKPKDKKTLAFIVVLCCSPFLCLVLHDTRPWAGRPTIRIINGRLLEVGCIETQKAMGGDRSFPISGAMYSFGGNGGFVHTRHRFMTTYNAPLGLWMTSTRNTYAVGTFLIDHFDMTYSSVNPSKITQPPASALPLTPPAFSKPLAHP